MKRQSAFWSIAILIICLLSTSQAFIQNVSVPALLERPGGSGAGGRGGGNRGSRRTGHDIEYPELPARPPTRFKPTEADVAEYDLGRAAEDQDQLYWNFGEPAAANFFAKVFTFFVTIPEYSFLLESANNVYAGEVGDDQPFKANQPPYQENQLPLTGQPLRFPRQDDSLPEPQIVTSAFVPSQAVYICDLWLSLAEYCTDGGDGCGCYSRSYYVPDMWNSMAAGCALGWNNDYACSSDDYWCSIAETASSYTEYCTLDPDAVKFAATVAGSGVPMAQATQPDAPVDTPAPTDPPMPASSPESPSSSTTTDSFSEDSTSASETSDLPSSITSMSASTPATAYTTSTTHSPASRHWPPSIPLVVGSIVISGMIRNYCVF